MYCNICLMDCENKEFHQVCILGGLGTVTFCLPCYKNLKDGDTLMVKAPEGYTAQTELIPVPPETTYVTGKDVDKKEDTK